MNFIKRTSSILAAALICAAWAFAQSSTQQGVPYGSNAGANSGSTAIIDQSGSPSYRPLITSNPGAAFPFPGWSPTGSDWFLYWPVAEHVYSVKVIKRVAKGKVKGVILEPEAIPANDNDVQLVRYWPEYNVNPGDKIIGRASSDCGYEVPVEECISAAIKFLRYGDVHHKGTGTDRVAVHARAQLDTNTSSFGVGVGGDASRMTQFNNDGASASLGLGYGRTKVGVHPHYVFDVVALNQGSFEPPPAPVAPQVAVVAPPPPPAPQAQVVKVEVQPIKLELVAPAPIPMAVSLITPPPPPTPVVREVPPPQADVCDAVSATMPKLTVYFGFDSSVLSHEFDSQIKGYVDSMSKHPKCKVQTEGHTCKSGSKAYDYGLAGLRAEALYNRMIALGADKAQLLQAASFGKEKLLFIDPANDPLNRRAAARFIDEHSSEK